MCYFCIDGSNILNAWAAALAESVRTPWLTEVMIVVTNLGGPINMTMFSLAIVLFLWLNKKVRHLVQFVLTILVGNVAIGLIKITVQLQRPEGGLVYAPGYSFASGHAAYAIIFFALIAYSYKSHIKSSFWRSLFVGACLMAAFFIGISRVYLGVHYMTDVLAGFAVGAVISAFSMLIFESYKRGLANKRVGADGPNASDLA